MSMTLEITQIHRAYDASRGAIDEDKEANAGDCCKEDEVVGHISGLP